MNHFCLPLDGPVLDSPFANTRIRPLQEGALFNIRQLLILVSEELVSAGRASPIRDLAGWASNGPVRCQFFPAVQIRRPRGRSGTMDGQKPWRLEANNPLTSCDWQPLFEFDEDKVAAFQELRDELNRINAPVQLRIVSNSDRRAPKRH